MKYQEKFEELVSLLNRYSDIYRANTQPARMARLEKVFPGADYDPEDHIVKETLLEHVGSLPIIASYLHPYLEHEVDLGKVLQMLAIHDIGETIVGDVNIFEKDSDADEKENEEALQIMHNNYHDLFLEFEEMETSESKFAKTVDKIAPDILDFQTPKDVTITIFKTQINKDPEEIVPVLLKHKLHFMEWDGFCKNFYKCLIDNLQKQLVG